MNPAPDPTAPLGPDDFDAQDAELGLLSELRLDDLAAAIWAVYGLRQLWKSLGPRSEAVRKEPEPGRNE